MIQAQTSPLIHARECGTVKNCRINIITAKEKLNSHCSGKLFNELDCEMDLKTGEGASEFTILCKDKELVSILDATVPVEAYSYRVTKIIRSEGTEKFSLNPRTYYNFEHPAFKANLSRQNEELNGEMFLLLNKTEYKMDNVNCSSSESAPSSGEPAQNENQS